MSIKESLKKCGWIALVILMTLLMIHVGQTVTERVRIGETPSIRAYLAVLREILKEIAVIVPVWLLSALGLIRSFLGENWFPFAQRIPFRATKITLIAAALLLVIVSAAGVVYAEYTEDPHRVRNLVSSGFDGGKTVLAWVLFYVVLLYAEQRGIQRNISKQGIRKMQVWITLTAFLTYLILSLLDCVALWYTPLSRVDSTGTLEDYYLWWFCLFLTACMLPLWFFSARKTVRLFKNNQWLKLSGTIPQKVTVLAALVLAGLTVWQIWECNSVSAWAAVSEIPERAEAAAMGHLFQAMIWGLALIYVIIMLGKQILSRRKACKSSKKKN